MKFKLNEEVAYEYTRAFPLRVHVEASLATKDFKDRVEFTLTNKETGAIAERTYYKLQENVLTVEDAMKIDHILYFMHNEINLNLWGFDLNK